MDISVLIYAVIALAGVAIGWLISSYQHAQQKADQLAEREEIVAELSAAKQRGRSPSSAGHRFLLGRTHQLAVCRAYPAA